MNVRLVAVIFLMTNGFAQAQTPTPSKVATVYEVGKDGLKIDGKLTKGDPPLVNAPIGQLNGAPHQVFQVKLQKGQSYVIDLVSKDFDAYLILQNALGTLRDHDDDSGGGLNSRIVYVAPADGVYRLVAAALDRKPSAFQLKLRAGELTAEQKLADEARALNSEGIQHYRAGRYPQAMAKWRQALELRQKLYPAAKYPAGHPDLAVSLNNLGFVLHVMGQAEGALNYYRESLEMTQKLYPAAKYPAGHTKLAASLNNLGTLLEDMGQAEQALGYHRQSLEMMQKLYPTAKFPAGHPELATSFNNLGSVFLAMGQAERALGYYRQSLEMRQTLYPAAKYPAGYPDLAQSLNNLGFVLKAMGQAEQAFGYLRQSHEMLQKLYPAAQYPAGHRDLARSLNNLGTLFQAMGQAEQALGYFRQGLEMTQKLYPAAKYPGGHPDLALSLNNLGFVHKTMGQAEQALSYFRQGLEMRQKLYPAAKYPAGHPDLATSLNNLGGVLREMGQAEQALGYFRQSHEMRQKLYPAAKYPAGHPDLARSLINVGSVLQAMGQAEQALGYYRQSHEMMQKLYPAAKYPAGHPELAISLTNLGRVLQAMGQAEQAFGYYRQSLEMKRKLYPAANYPEGHPDLALGLHIMGGVLQSLGEVEQALGYHRESLEMQQRLLRRELTTSSEEAAFDKIKAEPLVHDAYLTVTGTLKTAGGEALAAIWPSLALVTRVLEGRQANARAAGSELGEKVDRLRGFRRRMDQLIQDAKMKPADRDKLLTSVAEERDRLERELVQEMPVLTRWDELDKLGPTDLARALPPGTVFIDVLRYTHIEYVDKKQKRTPRYVAFVVGSNAPADPRRNTGTSLKGPLAPNGAEVNSQGRKPLEYGREHHASPGGAKVEDERRTFAPSGLDQVRHNHTRGLRPWLLTFTPSGFVSHWLINSTPSEILSSFDGDEGRPALVHGVVRVELDDAKPIDAAVERWRMAIEKRVDSAAARELSDLVWAKLANALPAGTKTIYLAADGDLARVPWAALPVANVGPDRSPIPRVLLEDYAIAQVPHGIFLLDHLLHPRKYAGPETLLALGGVDYNTPDWPVLPGTLTEMKALAAISPGERQTASGKDATIERLTKLMPTVRYAHLATHGEFKAQELTEEKKRATKALETRFLGETGFPGDTRRIAAKNPLGYVGLVLSEGKIMSGLSIVDLDLSNTKLVTLSACETGLGEYTAGEGVQGLQRAFHVAGCPNVVASLWKVNDAATAALMTKFYHEMWVNKKPPIEALREAQLTIYRHPELIPVLAGERGRPLLDKAVRLPETAPTGATRADTKLWAAFVLSGLGK